LSAASDPYRASPLKTRSFSPGLANLDFEMKVFTYGYRAKNSAQARSKKVIEEVSINFS
jgi:hypothetical protein